MQVTEALVPALVELMRPDLSPDDLRARVERMRGRVTSESPDMLLPHVLLDADGQVCAALWLLDPVPGQVVLGMPRTAPDSDAAPLVMELVAKARSLGYERMQSRQKKGGLTPAFQAALDSAGFVVTGERMEYEARVADLPARGKTPFTWQSYAELPMEELGALIETAGAGPEWKEHDDGVEFIRECLTRTGLTHGPDCIQVGSLDGAPAAFVVAQVDPSDGWCSLTLMGLVPERRGQGLGAHVHRHGFEMLRSQGGTHYHDGTSRENEAMLGLFERHGCRLSAHLVELEAKL